MYIKKIDIKNLYLVFIKNDRSSIPRLGKGSFQKA